MAIASIPLDLLDKAANTPQWQQWFNKLPAELIAWQRTAHYTLFKQGWQIVQQLPPMLAIACDLSQGVTVQGRPLALAPVTPPTAAPLVTAASAKVAPPWQRPLAQQLQQLRPWRKGPFHLYGIHLDSEWRADWKWQRLLPHITPLAGRLVLDVGCGNGYYLWRMVGAGARCALGIDPMGRFLAQFTAIRHLLGGHYPAIQLPYPLEQLPPLASFDTVFSMGVLYHRRDPLAHLQQLKQQLRPGGELVLETLILPDETLALLIPQQRYAQMRNVYAIPSVATLLQWLRCSGFSDLRLMDKTHTTRDEQRCTAWSSQHSLADCLTQDADKTVEGYPAPLRALIIARAA